jgi:Ca-activated chloride channel homolog
MCVRTMATIVVFLLCFVPSPSPGQSRPRRVVGNPGATAPPADDPADSTPVSLEGAFVEVPVVVSDRAGRYVPSLTKQDFALFEDGQSQEITSFESDRVPLHVAILIDASSSTRDSLDDIERAAEDFLGQLLPGDEIMVVSFNDRVRVEQDFTGDRDRLQKAVRKPESRQGTKLYDAVFATVAERMRRVEGRKAVILLSDGDDTRSDHSFEEAVTACVESDVMVYGLRYPKSWSNVLSMPGRGSKKKGWRIPGLPGIPKIPGVKQTGGSGDFMETVTSSTGGSLHAAASIGDLRGLFGRIAEELRHIYRLGYSPSNPISNGGYRAISVRVPSNPDLHVRHRLGYRAQARP